MLKFRRDLLEFVVEKYESDYFFNAHAVKGIYESETFIENVVKPFGFKFDNIELIDTFACKQVLAYVNYSEQDALLFIIDTLTFDIHAYLEVNLNDYQYLALYVYLWNIAKDFDWEFVETFEQIKEESIYSVLLAMIDYCYNFDVSKKDILVILEMIKHIVLIDSEIVDKLLPSLLQQDNEEDSVTKEILNNHLILFYNRNGMFIIDMWTENETGVYDIYNIFFEKFSDTLLEELRQFSNMCKYLNIHKTIFNLYTTYCLYADKMVVYVLEAVQDFNKKMESIMEFMLKNKIHNIEIKDNL